MSILDSYDPIQMLSNNQPLSPDIAELLQIDLHQYWLNHFGKARLFAYLDYKFNESGRQMLSFELTLLSVMTLLLFVSILTRLRAIFRAWSDNYERTRTEMIQTADLLQDIRNRQRRNRLQRESGEQNGQGEINNQ